MSARTLLVLAGLAAGCASLPEPKLVGEPTLRHYQAPLLPAACEAAYDGRARTVALVVCGGGMPEVAELYGAMDPSYPEPLDVALVLIGCVGSGQCDGDRLNPTRLADLHHQAVTLDP